MSAVVEVLTKARALIEKPDAWAKGANARTAEGEEVPVNDRDAVCFCAVGATIATRDSAASHHDAGISARIALLRALPVKVGVPDFNDDPATTHADILALFDRAIAAQQVVS